MGNIRRPFRKRLTGVLAAALVAGSGTAVVGALAAQAPASAAPVTPTDLGSAQADYASETSSLSLTLTTSVPAGATILVVSGAFGRETGPTGVACSDTPGPPDEVPQPGDTFHTDVSNGDGSGFAAICSASSAGLPSGSTITVSWSGASDVFNQRVHAYYVTGLESSPLDQTASVRGRVGDSPSSGATGTTTQDHELLFGAVLDEGAPVSGSGFAPGTNATTNACATSGTSTYTPAGSGVGSSALPPALFGEYCEVSTTGQYAAQAVLTGNPIWTALVATYKLAPTMAPSTTTLSVSPTSSYVGQPVTLSANVAPVPPGTGIPTGTVTFYDATTSLGTVTLNSSGAATLTDVTGLPVGSDALTAVYSGDQNFLGSTSPVATETVSDCAVSTETPYLLTATTNVGTIYGLFCVNEKGIGTYAQGSASGLATMFKHGNTTVVAALGTNLELAGKSNAHHNNFGELAPLKAIGTFTVSNESSATGRRA